ncbi:hypothetical protein FZ934_01555 [Rhizobium grahamii]|uniref:Uncharacterized protein n=1 Tax=Rhizobium grahamii TaxID=1120045 RepID=A0A5Q0C100_9HYPH|nr:MULTISPECIES: hypothetical protein [Rhizobium]QFY59242.1 hypothetical protein FZ934_01555 [Rhizobium grahamii]QRM48233.1 hypothetical protein F3Y33_02325 [Rhizobium sp. BG6]
MSSTIDTTNLSAKDLKMLNGVLASCGYSDNISGSLTDELNVACKLIIRLFHQGIREPAHLAGALHRNFGKPLAALNSIYVKGLHRYAIQGITPLRGRRVHTNPPSAGHASIIVDR